MLRGSRWGLFIGTSAALFWDYVNFFVTTFLKNGFAQLALLQRTGHMPRPDLFISVPGWLGNAAVVIGSVFAYMAMSDKRPRDGANAGVAFVATTSYFALIIYLCQPCYLALFPACLHPHLHF